MIYNAISLCRASLIAFNIVEFGHPATRYVHPYEALKQPRDAYLCLSIPEAPQRLLSSCHGWYRDRRGLGNMLNGTVLEDFELLEAMISEGLMGDADQSQGSLCLWCWWCCKNHILWLGRKWLNTKGVFVGHESRTGKMAVFNLMAPLGKWWKMKKIKYSLHKWHAFHSQWYAFAFPMQLLFEVEDPRKLGHCWSIVIWFKR